MGWTWKCWGTSRHSCLNLGGHMNILKVMGGGAALLAMALTASANGVPTKTRSAYGSDGSPVQLLNQSTTSDGVTIDSNFLLLGRHAKFRRGGPATAAWRFKLPQRLPAGTTGITLDLPIPAGASLNNEFSIPVGFLTNDSPISSPTNPILPFSPFSIAQAGAFLRDAGHGRLGKSDVHSAVTAFDPGRRDRSDALYGPAR